jgi:non-heme chloroperoxidase
MPAKLATALLCTVASVAAAQPAWRDPSPHQTRFVAVEPSVRLEVLDWGGSGPPLVLLACYISTHAYDDIAPKLTNQFHVYGITRRGIGASDKPATGYAVQQSVNDVIEVLNALQVRKALVVGHSCAGQVLTMLTARHSDRLLGLVYLDGAGDPTMTAADVGSPMPDPKMLPSPLKPRSAPDYTSFEALRASQLRDRGWAFPEGELRQQFAANADGSVSASSQLSSTIRRAITMDARVKPNYSHVTVPVLAIYQKDPPFEQVAANFLIRNEQERAALRQEHAATRALYVRWQRDLLAAVPAARIVELEGASLYMFMSNEADVIREVRAFAATHRFRIPDRVDLGFQKIPKQIRNPLDPRSEIPLAASNQRRERAALRSRRRADAGVARPIDVGRIGRRACRRGHCLADHRDNPSRRRGTGGGADARGGAHRARTAR